MNSPGKCSSRVIVALAVLMLCSPVLSGEPDPLEEAVDALLGRLEEDSDSLLPTVLMNRGAMHDENVSPLSFGGEVVEFLQSTNPDYQKKREELILGLERYAMAHTPKTSGVESMLSVRAAQEVLRGYDVTVPRDGEGETQAGRWAYDKEIAEWAALRETYSASLQELNKRFTNLGRLTAAEAATAATLSRLVSDCDQYINVAKRLSVDTAWRPGATVNADYGQALSSVRQRANAARGAYEEMARSFKDLPVNVSVDPESLLTAAAKMIKPCKKIVGFYSSLYDAYVGGQEDLMVIPSGVMSAEAMHGLEHHPYQLPFSGEGIPGDAVPAYTKEGAKWDGKATFPHDSIPDLFQNIADSLPANDDQNLIKLNQHLESHYPEFLVSVLDSEDEKKTSIAGLSDRAKASQADGNHADAVAYYTKIDELEGRKEPSLATLQAMINEEEDVGKSLMSSAETSSDYRRAYAHFLKAQKLTVQWNKTRGLFQPRRSYDELQELIKTSRRAYQGSDSIDEAARQFAEDQEKRSSRLSQPSQPASTSRRLYREQQELRRRLEGIIAKIKQLVAAEVREGANETRIESLQKQALALIQDIGFKNGDIGIIAYKNSKGEPTPDDRALYELSLLSYRSVLSELGEVTNPYRHEHVFTMSASGPAAENADATRDRGEAERLLRQQSLALDHLDRLHAVNAPDVSKDVLTILRDSANELVTAIAAAETKINSLVSSMSPEDSAEIRSSSRQSVSAARQVVENIHAGTQRQESESELTAARKEVGKDYSGILRKLPKQSQELLKDFGSIESHRSQVLSSGTKRLPDKSETQARRVKPGAPVAAAAGEGMRHQPFVPKRILQGRSVSASMLRKGDGGAVLDAIVDSAARQDRLDRAIEYLHVELRLATKDAKAQVYARLAALYRLKGDMARAKQYLRLQMLEQGVPESAADDNVAKVLDSLDEFEADRAGYGGIEVTGTEIKNFRTWQTTSGNTVTTHCSYTLVTHFRRTR